MADRVNVGVCATCAEARGGRSKRGGPLWSLGTCGICEQEWAVCPVGDVAWPNASTRKAVLAKCVNFIMASPEGPLQPGEVGGERP